MIRGTDRGHSTNPKKEVSNHPCSASQVFGGVWTAEAWFTGSGQSGSELGPMMLAATDGLCKTFQGVIYPEKNPLLNVLQVEGRLRG